MSSIAAGLSRTAALRIGLAARALPDTTPRRLMTVLMHGLGLPLTEEKLNGVSLRILRTALEGEFSEVDAVYLKQAVRLLKGEAVGAADAGPPRPQPLEEDQPLPDSIRVAFASNSGERLDGHFGACLRFLIYQVAAAAARLIAVRPVVEPAASGLDEVQAYRVSLVSDCHLLYVVSIGGPPAARVVRAGVHPIRHPEPAEIQDLIPPLQKALAASPPPWLRRIISAAR